MLKLFSQLSAKLCGGGGGGYHIGGVVASHQASPDLSTGFIQGGASQKSGHWLNNVEQTFLVQLDSSTKKLSADLAPSFGSSKSPVKPDRETGKKRVKPSAAINPIISSKQVSVGRVLRSVSLTD